MAAPGLLALAASSAHLSVLGLSVVMWAGVPRVSGACNMSAMHSECNSQMWPHWNILSWRLMVLFSDNLSKSKIRFHVAVGLHSCAVRIRGGSSDGYIRGMGGGGVARDMLGGVGKGLQKVLGKGGFVSG
eukprot:scaffold33806_cov45-Attheya_sp.AAC.4